MHGKCGRASLLGPLQTYCSKRCAAGEDTHKTAPASARPAGAHNSMWYACIFLARSYSLLIRRGDWSDVVWAAPPQQGDTPGRIMGPVRCVLSQSNSIVAHDQ